MSKGFSKSAEGRACSDFHKSHLCKFWTGDRQDPVPCQCPVSLKQFHIPARITDQELNMAPDLFIIFLAEGGHRESLDGEQR